MAHYLVTGGAGFIGSSIADFLAAQGESVRVLDNLSTGYAKNLAHLERRIEFINGDIRDPEACSHAVCGVDYVLHQAAVPSVPRSVADPVLSHESGTTGTLNMLLAARDAKVKRFVFAGSSSVYGDQPGEFKHEEIMLSPLSPYAATKAAGEHYLQAFSTCFGMETVTLRYFNVFGPRQDPDSPYSAVIPIFIRLILREKSPVIYGDGLQARDFTFVENNVRANILAATGDFEAKGQVYNIAAGESYTLLDLVAEINSLLGKNVEPVFEPARVGDIRLSKADISRARADLRYQVFVPFREGIRRTIEWYAAQEASRI